VIAAGIGLAAGALGPRLPPAGTRPPFDPRSLVHPQRDIEQSVNPLAVATRWLAEPAAPLFDVDTTDPVNQRLAVLGGYDGREWSSDAGYVPAGRRLPEPAGATSPSARTVRETVTVGDLPTVWLPAPDRPVAVEGARLRVDPRTALLAVPAGAPASGLRYTVTCRVPGVTADLASTDVPASGPQFEPYRALPPGVPASLLRDADDATRAAVSPYQQMVLLQELLRSRLRYDVRAAPGRTLGHIRFFYEESHRGTADQFATAFALMARSVGFPARIAVGFTPGREVAAGRYQVATTDVLVWPEVAFRDLGWVPFYPVPRPSEDGAGTVQRSVGQPPDRAAVDDAVARSQPVLPRPADRPGSDRDGRAAAGGPQRSRVGWYPVGAAGLLIGYLLAGLAVRRVRSLRRRSGTPGHQVVGAWHEGVDGLARLADPGLRAMTTEETARWTGERLGPDAGAAMARLGALTCAALFSTGPSSPAEAADAWQDCRRVVCVVNRSLGPGRRLGHLLRPPWTAGRPGKLVSR
jgi:transglutaminase-like putative cysteine protease